MSTEFVSSNTGELGFVRWCGGSRGLLYEFGTITNWENVVSWVKLTNDRFVPITGNRFDNDPVTVGDFEELVCSGRATFGEFYITVEVGSGEMARFSIEE